MIGSDSGIRQQLGLAVHTVCVDVITSRNSRFYFLVFDLGHLVKKSRMHQDQYLGDVRKLKNLIHFDK